MQQHLWILLVAATCYRRCAIESAESCEDESCNSGSDVGALLQSRTSQVDTLAKEEPAASPAPPAASDAMAADVAEIKESLNTIVDILDDSYDLQKKLAKRTTIAAKAVFRNFSKASEETTPNETYVPRFNQSFSIEGEKFAEAFNFFTLPDPTHGYLRYVGQDEARQEGIFKVNEKNQLYLGVVTGRNEAALSVRLESKLDFGVGAMYVLDVEHIPVGEGMWPAWWSTGPNWPNSGEIDTIEQVNEDPALFHTLHTKAGCNMGQVPGVKEGGNCNAPGTGTTGCGVQGRDGGSVLNAEKGGVFVTYWTTESIKFWYFSRDKQPEDLWKHQDPNPDAWQAPTVTFPFSDACPGDFFQKQQLIINTCVCGDWAGAVFSSGPGGCEGFIRDPYSAKKLSEAYWLINSVRVYYPHMPESASVKV